MSEQADTETVNDVLEGIPQQDALAMARDILCHLGNFPERPESMPFEVSGRAEIVVGTHSKTPSLLLWANGVGVGLKLTTPQLLQLQAEIQAALKALKVNASALH
jgi:hypothetical protein